MDETPYPTIEIDGEIWVDVRTAARLRGVGIGRIHQQISQHRWRTWRKTGSNGKPLSMAKHWIALADLQADLTVPR